MTVDRPRRNPPLRLDRIEAYLSLIFSGNRLVVWAGAVLFFVMTVLDDRNEWRAASLAVLVAVVFVFVAEIVLIRAVSKALKRGRRHRVASLIAGGIRRRSLPLRLILAFAYVASTGLTFLGTYLTERVWSEAYHWTDTTKLIGGFVVAMAVSYSANLTLLAALSALRTPRRAVDAVFRGRMLIDAAAGLVTAVLLTRK